MTLCGAPASRIARSRALAVGFFVWPLQSVRCPDDLDIVLRQVVDERVDLDAFDPGAFGQVVADLGIEIDRKPDRRAGFEELAAHAVREVDSGRHVVMGRRDGRQGERAGRKRSRDGRIRLWTWMARRKDGVVGSRDWRNASMDCGLGNKD